MRNFFLIFLSYVKRFFRDIKEVVLLLVIPIGLIVINSFFGDATLLEDYNIGASTNMPAFMLAFQFFNMGIMLYFLFNDFKGEMRWRLRAAPHSLLTFVLPAFVASWVFSLIIGVVIVLVSVIFLNAYLGNVLVLVVVLLIVSLMASFISMLIFLFAKNFKVANGLVYVISFGLMILSGFMFPLGNSDIAVFMNRFGTPLALGQRAIMYSGQINDLLGGGMEQSIINIGILAAITLVLGIVTIVAARRIKI
ncbi:MAG: ABC transporter permease [Defluviitaleaceae bacterium]|nr:ABC transporter permease [Defluviitaleaceae bacterium]